MSSSGGSGLSYGHVSLSSKSQSGYSSSVDIGTFSDQDIKAADIESSTSGSATSKHSSQDLYVSIPGAAAETPSPENIQTKTYTIPYGIHSGKLTSGTLNIDYILDDISKETIKIWPKSMEEYLSSRYKNIIPMIKSQCTDGDVIFIAHSLMTTLAINTFKCPPSVLCDICIFSSTRPILVMTLDTAHVPVRNVTVYNAKLTKALTEATRKKGEFCLTNGVFQVKTDFTSEKLLKEIITQNVQDSSFGATGTTLQMNQEKFNLAIKVFCARMFSCYHPDIEQLYFTDIMSQMLMEVFEERQSIEIKSSVKDPALLLLREMWFRLTRSKITCMILCPQEYIEDVQLANMNIVQIEEEKGNTIILTSTPLENVKWKFVVGESSDVHGDESSSSTSHSSYSSNVISRFFSGQDNQDSDFESATSTQSHEAQERSKNETAASDKDTTRGIVKGIIDKSTGDRKMTRSDKIQLEEIVRFSLSQFESRAVTFFGELLHEGLEIDVVHEYNAHMEDYLMQCFRQRNLELTSTGPTEAFDSDLDTHLHSIKKLTPLLNKGLKLEDSPLLPRLVQHDVMSEAGRQSIMGRTTPTSRNRAFITYLCGNFTSETFKAQFLPILSEEHFDLAISLEDEMERMTIASKKNNKCMFCKMKDTVNIRRLMDALLQMDEISDSLRRELSASALPNTVKWTQLFKHVRNVESIMRALEQKHVHFYREYILKGHSFWECTCEASESQRLSDVVCSDAENPDGDVANMADFEADSERTGTHLEDDDSEGSVVNMLYFDHSIVTGTHIWDYFDDDYEGSVVNLADSEDNSSVLNYAHLVHIEGGDPTKGDVTNESDTVEDQP